MESAAFITPLSTGEVVFCFLSNPYITEGPKKKDIDTLSMYMCGNKFYQQVILDAIWLLRSES